MLFRSLSTDMEFLFAKLSHVAEKVSCFSVCGLKEILPYIKNVKQSSAFDVIVAAYLLNPLKSDYTYEDVAACRRRRAKYIMIRPYSHSPSVQSVAGDG